MTALEHGFRASLMVSSYAREENCIVVRAVDTALSEFNAMLF